MAKKQISPKLFTQESAATPKHDDMLIKFNKEYCKKFMLKKQMDGALNSTPIFLSKYTESKKVFWCIHNTSFFHCAYNDKWYTLNEDKKSNDFFEKKELKEFTEKITNKELDWGDLSIISKFKKFKEKEFFLEIEAPKEDWANIIWDTSNFDIEWIPEHPITNRGYYIGSVDLLIKSKGKITANLIHSSGMLKENFYIFNWDDSKYEEGYGVRYKKSDIFVFEFKPILKSVSEAIRQIKVYERYLSGTYFLIVNEMKNFEKWKKILESQEITLIKNE